MQLNELRNKNIHLLGLSGTEGSSLALFFIDLGYKNLFGHDFSPPAQFKKNYITYHENLSLKVINQQINKIRTNFKTINFQKNYLKDIDEADVIFAPSSWFRYKINQPLKRAVPKKIFWNWYNLILAYYPGKIVGVTGTAGKGTTTNLIYQILKAAQKNVWLIGESWQSMPLSQIINGGPNSWVVVEVSNRTLTFAKNVKKSPAISVITNITKNHLDDHGGSFKKYIAVKEEIGRYQNKNDYLILNSDNVITKKLKNLGQGKKIFYSYKNPERKLIKNENIIGQHFIADAVAAIKVAKILKIRKSIICQALKKFKARPGRMQFIKRIQDITFINDAASTRPEVTIEAIKSFPKKSVHLILEGSRYKPDKKQFLKLIKAIIQQKVKRVVVSGQIADFLYPLLQKAGVNSLKTKRLIESLKVISSLAKPQENVLFSPSCESFGEFKDYRERIIAFNQFIKKLK